MFQSLLETFQNQFLDSDMGKIIDQNPEQALKTSTRISNLQKVNPKDFLPYIHKIQKVSRTANLSHTANTVDSTEKRSSPSPTSLKRSVSETK